MRRYTSYASARRVLSVEDADAPLMKRVEGGNPDLDEGMTLQQFLLHKSKKSMRRKQMTGRHETKSLEKFVVEKDLSHLGFTTYQLALYICTDLS